MYAHRMTSAYLQKLTGSAAPEQASTGTIPKCVAETRSTHPELELLTILDAFLLHSRKLNYQGISVPPER